MPWAPKQEFRSTAPLSPQSLHVCAKTYTHTRQSITVGLQTYRTLHDRRLRAKRIPLKAPAPKGTEIVRRRIVGADGKREDSESQ